MVKAKKSLGQNFLVDQTVLDHIIQAAELQPEDHVLEVGPGKAALTQRLLEHAGQVTAVELDDRLIPELKSEFGANNHFTLIHGDALETPPPPGPYKLVANLPYYITSPLLNHYLLEQFHGGNPPQQLVIMVQKEVAEKILAKKGRHSVLSLQVHLFGDPELVCIVPPEAFEPAPKVHSAVLKIRVHPQPKIQVDLDGFFKLLHRGFAQKRKKLSNNLAGLLNTSPKDVKQLLESLNIDPNARAEALTLSEWEQLYKTISERD